MKDRKLSEFTSDPHNANKGNPRGAEMIRRSFEKYGAGRSILVDKDGVVIAGNKSLENAMRVGMEDAVVVESDGTKLIVVQRTDLKASDPKGIELAIADNRTGQVNLEWDIEKLQIALKGKSLPPPPMVHIGVWEDGQFVGAILFSRGANNNLFKPYGLEQTQGCELVRVALKSHQTPVSRIVSIALRFLKQKSPSLRLIVSFADPAEGHHGGIYQAMNWVYAGQNESSIEYIGPDGKRWHGRMVKKQGWTTVYGKRRKVLTPSQCIPVPRCGKYRYLMPLDSEMREKIEKLRKPYPKRVKMDAVSAPHQSADESDPPAPTQDNG